MPFFKTIFTQKLLKISRIITNLTGFFCFFSENSANMKGFSIHFFSTGVSPIFLIMLFIVSCFRVEKMSVNLKEKVLVIFCQNHILDFYRSACSSHYKAILQCFRRLAIQHTSHMYYLYDTLAVLFWYFGAWQSQFSSFIFEVVWVWKDMTRKKVFVNYPFNSVR